MWPVANSAAERTSSAPTGAPSTNSPRRFSVRIVAITGSLYMGRAAPGGEGFGLEALLCFGLGTLVRPAQQRRSGSESRAYRRQQHRVAFLQLAFVERGLHGQRNGSRRGVAVAVRT